MGTNDYHQLPATTKQIQFARYLAGQTGATLPWEVQQDRRQLSQWIDAQQRKQKPNAFSSYPSSKQVEFAERIARYKKRQVPHECFRDKQLMSRWIDSNK